MAYIDTLAQAQRARALQPTDPHNYFAKSLTEGANNFAKAYTEGYNKEADRRAKALEVEQGVYAKLGQMPVPEGTEGEDINKGLYGSYRLAPSTPSQEAEINYKNAMAQFALGLGRQTGGGRSEKSLDQLTAEAEARAAGTQAASDKTKVNARIRDLDVADDYISNIENDLKDSPKLQEMLGPTSGRLESGLSSIGFGDPDFENFMAKARNNLSKAVKTASGTAASDAERAHIQTFEPSENDTPSKIMAKIKGMKDFNSVEKNRLSAGVRPASRTFMPASTIPSAPPPTAPKAPPSGPRIQKNKKTGEIRIING